jgi:hypothetical protein
MGWLGWSEDQALAADVNAIQAGYAGKMDMLRMCFGSGEPAAPSKRHKGPPTGGGGKPVKISAAAFDAVFGDKGR